MTNKLFIVKYVFVDIDNSKNVDEILENEIDTLLRNSNIENDNRENFDDIIDFDIIDAQNICVFDIAKNVANEINKIKINKTIKEIENEVSNEVKKTFEDICENVFDEANNTNSLDINCTSFFW